MPVRFSLSKAASFRPWSKKDLSSRVRSGSPSGREMHAGSGIDVSAVPRLHSSPERYRDGHLDRVPEDGAVDFDYSNDEDEEDEEEELDEELASQGFYRGSYKRLLALYTFTPLTFALSFALLGLLPTWLYPLEITPSFPSLIPFPLPELIVSIGLWSLAYLLRTPIYTISVLICTSCRLSHYSFSTVLSTVLHAILSLLLRLITIPVLLIPHYLVYETPTWHDPAFRRVWWVALGWAAAEAIVAIKQGYDNIALYRDVLIDERLEEDRFIDIEDGATKLGRVYGATTTTTPVPRAAEPTSAPVPGSSRDASSGPPADSIVDPERIPLLRASSGTSNQNLEASLELQVDEDVEQLMAVRARDELEKFYGIPFIRIPVFIACLQRANSLLFSLGITLLLSSAYLQSSLVSDSNSTAHPVNPVYVINSDSPYILPLETFISNTWPWSPTQLLPAQNVKSNQPLAIVVPLVCIVQLLLSLLHSQLVLPKAGVHTVVYIGSLVSLGAFFAGLGLWDALS